MKNFFIHWLTLIIISSYSMVYAMILPELAKDKIKPEDVYAQKARMHANLFYDELKSLSAGKIIAREFEDKYRIELANLCSASPNLHLLKCYLQVFYVEFDVMKMEIIENAQRQLDSRDLDYIQTQIGIHLKMKAHAEKFINNPDEELMKLFFNEAKTSFLQSKGCEVAWLHLKHIQALVKKERTDSKKYENIHLEIFNPLYEILVAPPAEQNNYEKTLNDFHVYAQALHKQYKQDGYILSELRKSLNEKTDIDSFSAINIAYEMALHEIMQLFAEASCKVRTPDGLKLVCNSIREKLEDAGEQKKELVKSKLYKLGKKFANNLLNSALQKEWRRADVYANEPGYEKLWQLMDDMRRERSEKYDERFFEDTWFFLQVFCKGFSEILQPWKEAAKDLTEKQKNLFKVKFCFLLVDVSMKILDATEKLKHADQNQAHAIINTITNGGAQKIIEEFEQKFQELKKCADIVSP